MNFTNLLKLECFKNAKEPIKGSTFKDPSKEKNFGDVKVSELLKKNNVGILTGKVNNLICIDLDNYKDDFKFNYDHHTIDDLMNMTYCQKTGKGGLHLVYQYDPQIKQKQNIVNDNICQVDTRSDKGYFILAGSKVDGNEYKVINNIEPIKIPDTLKQFLLKNGYGESTPNKISKKASTVSKNTVDIIDSSTKDFYIIDKHLKYILDQKPTDFFNNVEFWKFTTIMKFLNKKTMWDNFNKARPKYNEQKNNDIWNNVDASKANLSLLFDDKILNDSYFKLKYTENSLLKNSVKINKQKLGYDFFNTDIDYIVKSDTGTGKTTSVKSFIKKNNYKFISIVSRKTLGREQHTIFNEDGISCKYYENEDYFNDDDNIIIQIDSVNKLRRNIDFTEYIIILDECESILDHLFMSSTLKNRRCSVFKKFIDILQKCKNFIGIDADITKKSLCFFDKFIKRSYTTYNNTYKHNKDVKAYEIANQTDMINKILESEQYIVCCDIAAEAKDIHKKLTDNGQKDILLITSEVDEYYKFDDYKKIIFSPKIIYGIDSSMERDVFCWHKGTTISPREMVQQLSRARNIKNIYYNFINKKYNWNPITFKEVYNLNKESIKYGLNTDDTLLSNDFEYDQELEDKYLYLYSKFEYEEICYNTNKFAHFIKLLDQRGVVIMSNLFEIKKENKIKLQKREPLNIDEFFNIENNKKILDFIGLTKDEARPHFDLLKKFNFFGLFYSIKKYFYNNYDDIYYRDKINTDDDFLINSIKSSNQKLRYLKKLCEIVESNNKYNINAVKIPNKKQQQKLFDEYKIIFLQNKSYQKKVDLTNLYSINKFINDIYKTIFGNITKSKRLGTGKDRYYEYSIDEKIISGYDQITHKKRIKKLNKDIVHHFEQPFLDEEDDDYLFKCKYTSDLDKL